MKKIIFSTALFFIFSASTHAIQARPEPRLLFETPPRQFEEFRRKFEKDFSMQIVRKETEKKWRVRVTLKQNLQLFNLRFRFDMKLKKIHQLNGWKLPEAAFLAKGSELILIYQVKDLKKFTP